LHDVEDAAMVLSPLDQAAEDAVERELRHTGVGGDRRPEAGLVHKCFALVEDNCLDRHVAFPARTIVPSPASARVTGPSTRASAKMTMPTPVSTALTACSTFTTMRPSAAAIAPSGSD